MTRSRQLREQRASIHAEAQKLLNKPHLTSEDRERFDALMNEMDALKADIDREERLEQNDRDLRRTTRPPEAQIGSAFEETSSERRYAQAFTNYLRHGLYPDAYGFRGLSPEDLAVIREHRDMGTGGGNALEGTGGGYFVPVGFVNRVETALKYYGNMLGVATIMDTATGQPLPYPTSNDTAVTGELVGEGQSVSTQDVTLGNIVLGAYKFSTKMVKVSIELLQDSAFDLSTWLPDQFAVRLGRILNTKFTHGLGSGSNEPMGIITAATASGQTVIGDDNATSPDPTQQVGYLDLVTLEHSIDVAYRQGAKFMLHDTTLRFIKQLKDRYGHPLWTPGVASNAPDTILGYPYSINNDMDQLGAGKKTVAFGRLDKYLIRRVKGGRLARLKLSQGHHPEAE